MKLFRILVSFALALAFVFVMGYVCSMLITTDSLWWHSIKTPKFMPSNTVFEWVWMAIYLLIAIVATINIYNKPIHKGLILWGITIALNILWCAVFFVWHLTLLAFSLLIVIVIMLFTLTNYYIKNTRELWWTMIPLLAWYTFCAVLNYGVIMLN